MIETYKRGDILAYENSELTLIGTLNCLECNDGVYIPQFYCAVEIPKAGSSTLVSVIYGKKGEPCTDSIMTAKNGVYTMATDDQKQLYRKSINDSKPKKPKKNVQVIPLGENEGDEIVYNIIEGDRVEKDVPAKPNMVIDFRFDTSKVKVWFTSDPHFYHTNIIKFTNRPFKDINEMNETLIENWNKRVGKDDVIFILGDFCFGGSKEWNELLGKLNGRKYLIIGNHDEKNLRQGYLSKFEKVAYMMHIYVNGKSIYLSHFPILCYAGSYRVRNCVYALHGHVHSGERQSVGKDNGRLSVLFPSQYDVGVDNNNYRPVSFEEVMEKIEGQRKSKKWAIKTKLVNWLLKTLYKMFR